MMYYKPTPLFRADVWEIAHGVIIHTIQYCFWHCTWSQTTIGVPANTDTCTYLYVLGIAACLLVVRLIRSQSVIAADNRK